MSRREVIALDLQKDEEDPNNFDETSDMLSEVVDTDMDSLKLVISYVSVHFALLLITWAQA